MDELDKETRCYTWLGDNKILIAGGFEDEGGYVYRETSLDSMEVFDLAKQSSVLLEARMELRA